MLPAPRLDRLARALAVLVGCLFATGAGAQGEPTGAGPWMVRAWFGDATMKRAVAEWGDHFADLKEKGYLLIEADGERLEALRRLGFHVDLDAERTGWLRDGEAAARAAREAQARGAAPPAGIPGFPCYRTVEESFAAMVALAAAHPTLAAVVDAGDSWEKVQNAVAGYDMLVLKLTNSEIAGPKPKLFVTSSIHAREYTPAELVLRFGEELVNGYGTDADATWLLDEHEVHLMVHANPDGRKRAEAGLSWRKNVNNDYCTDSNNRGADLNRNFSFEWNSCPELGCSSANPCDNLYHGPTAASEPEIQAIQSYLVANFPDQRGPELTDPAPADATGVYLDIHSFSELILTPWGFEDPNVAPAPNGDAFRTAARKYALLSGYDPSLFIYEVDGASADFGYGELGIAASAWEMGTAFFESCASFAANILPSGLPMLRYAARVARTPFLTPSGPDVLALQASPLAAVPGGSVTVTATIDDARFSTQNGTEPVQPIAAAEAYLDLPPWRDGAAPIALAATDGAFDEVAEGVTASFPVPANPFGRHALFLRGRDSSGAWGAISAVFFHVLDPATAPTVGGFVREAGSGAPLAATVAAGPFTTDTDPATGAYSIQVPPGTYDLTASAADSQSATVPGVILAELDDLALDFDLVSFTTVLSSDGEAGAAGWTASPPWALTTEIAASPTHSWTDSPGGLYGNNVSTSLTSPLFDLSLASGVELTFKDLRDLEEGWDYGIVEVSTNGGAGWSEIARWDGEGQDVAWRDVALALPGLAGATNARLRFRLTSDTSVTFDGWHVDDIRVRAVLPTAALFFDGFENGSSSRWSSVSP